MPCYEIDGIRPVVHQTAYLHPTAVLIGDVIIGAGCYIGPGCSLRGDFGRLIVNDGGNIQDNCVMHGFPGTDTIVEIDGHIGHGAILHGCRIGRNAMVGMNAVVMDNATIGESAIVAASAFVKAGLEVPPRVLVAGVPARVIRDLREQELKWKIEGTKTYQALTVRSLTTMREVEPLSDVEENRKRITFSEEVKPLVEAKLSDPKKRRS
jgi:phenylacetic acid degradation protein